MLFGEIFKRPKPRGLTWVPRYYDPEDDAQYEEMRRQSRIRFDQLRRKSSRSRRGASPIILLVFAVMIALLMWVANRGSRPVTAGEVRLSPESAVQTGPQSPARHTETLLIETDTVRVPAVSGSTTHDLSPGERE